MEAASVEQARPAAKKRRKSAVGAEPTTPWWLWIAVAAIVIFCLVPFYWLVNISLKTGADLSGSDIFPPSPSLDNYTSIFENASFTKALRNSAIVALVTTILGIVVGSFAAYALARLRMRGKAILLAIVLSITTFPQIAIAAPLFRLWSDIGLYNTLIGLVIPYLTFALPLSIYILVSFFREIPKDLEATTLTTSPSARTRPVAISQFTGSSQFEVPLGTQSAALVVISIPLIILVLLFQKRIVAGLTAGAVKG